MLTKGLPIEVVRRFYEEGVRFAESLRTDVLPRRLPQYRARSMQGQGLQIVRFGGYVSRCNR